MKQLWLLGAGVMLAAAVGTTAQKAPAIAVVRDPGCGCCLQWVAHLQRAGFTTTVTESAAMEKVKDEKGVPASARSCHTGTVEGYVIEGHVPADDIKRLLKERPAIVGLAVPGMPMGSPGMEVPTGQVSPYNTLTFDKAGKTTVYASHGTR